MCMFAVLPRAIKGDTTFIGELPSCDRREASASPVRPENRSCPVICCCMLGYVDTDGVARAYQHLGSGVMEHSNMEYSGSSVRYLQAIRVST